MILDDNSKFSVAAMSEAINRLPATPTQIRALGIFTPRYLTTTYVDVENQDGTLRLVHTEARGTSGQGVDSKPRSIRTFKVPHLPKNDVIRADDVQNLRAFGTTQAQTVEAVVNDKLAQCKLDIEFTREHLMLGALQGQILDADGTVLYDMYKEFGMQRQSFTIGLGTATTEVGRKLDEVKSAMRRALKGEVATKWVALCGDDFLNNLKYHKSIKDLYTRFRDGAAYREGDAAMNPIEFEHNGIQFIQYDGSFGAQGAKIAPNQAILLPLGTRNTFAEYFAPADMIETVNTRAQPYYASREKLEHGKGWSIHAQSNPLPLVLRPEVVATLQA